MTLIENYLEWKAVKYPRAAVNYRVWLERFVQIVGKEYATSELETTKFHNLIADRYASKTVELAMIAVNNYHKYLYKKGVSCLDPYFIEVPKGIGHRRRPPEHADYLRVLDAIPENDFYALRDKLMISFIHDTGVRVSEASDINMDDLEPEKRRGVTRTRKNKEIRTIYWGEECNRLLKKYMPIRSELGYGDALFISTYTRAGSNARRLTTRTIERIFVKWCKRAGVGRRFTPHGLRHKWAEDRRDLGASLSFVQRGLGHKSPVSTFVYQQYVDKNFENEAHAYLEF